MACSNSSTSVKKFLVLDVVDILREVDKALHKEVWDDLTDHGLFKGNDTVMQFERFFSESLSVAEIKSFAEEGHEFSPVEMFFTQHIENHGYIYKDRVLYDDDDNMLNGVLLDINW